MMERVMERMVEQSNGWEKNGEEKNGELVGAKKNIFVRKINVKQFFM